MGVAEAEDRGGAGEVAVIVLQRIVYAQVQGIGTDDIWHLGRRRHHCHIGCVGGRQPLKMRSYASIGSEAGAAGVGHRE